MVSKPGWPLPHLGTLTVVHQNPSQTPFTPALRNTLEAQCSPVSESSAFPSTPLFPTSGTHLITSPPTRPPLSLPLLPPPLPLHPPLLLDLLIRSQVNLE